MAIGTKYFLVIRKREVVLKSVNGGRAFNLKRRVERSHTA
jgi:hypothetical protein